MIVTDTETQVNAREIAVELLGLIHWIEEDKGYCTCPGADGHSTKAGDADCIVYLDGAATISCFHQSCVDEREKANRALRAALAKGEGDGGVKLSSDERKQKQRREQKRRLLERRAASSLPLILKRYAWTYADIQKDSPVILAPHDVAAGWRRIAELYQPDDILWIGDTYSSGRPEHSCHFQTAAHWLKQPRVQGQFTCPATFKNDRFSRSNENVLARRFLVVESDILTKDQVGAVFRWLKDEVKLPLRAVVDTAGKSLHGWFDFPKTAVLEELRIILPQLCCDPGLFKSSQPCRLPGAIRDGKHQSLIYFCAKEGKQP